MMLNQVIGRLVLKLTTPFKLVHNTKRYKNKFEIFSMGYFNHMVDNTEILSKLQAHYVDVIDVGRDYT